MPETRLLFDSVAKNYDLLNTIFSMGRDRIWRKRLAKEIEGSGLILDIATGTAEVAIEVVNNARNSQVVGLDPSGEMLLLGKKKINSTGLHARIRLVQGVAEKLPFKDNAFDAITIAFGIRNTVAPINALTEMNRVLTRGGRLAILEFAVPQAKIFSPAYMFYLKNILPLVGSFFGTRKQYRYLGDSISEFPHREAFLKILSKSGYSVEKPIELMCGTVIIYIGIKRY